jgi:hypothetical protein
MEAILKFRRDPMPTSTLARKRSILVASNNLIQTFGILFGLADEGAITPDMLVFNQPVLQYFHSHPLRLAKLDLIISTNGQIDTDDNDCVSKLADFIRLFPRLRHLDLHFVVRDELHFHKFTQLLQVDHLEELHLAAIKCTDEVLTAFLLHYKEQLRQLSLIDIELLGHCDSWLRLLNVLHSRMSLRLLTMEKCEAAGQRLYYKLTEDGQVAYVCAFEKQGFVGWTFEESCFLMRNP